MLRTVLLAVSLMGILAPVASADLRADINTYRAGYGLAPIAAGSDPAAQAGARRLAEANASVAPAELGDACACVYAGADGEDRPAAEHYARATGTDHAGFSMYATAATLAQNLTVAPSSRALLLDPAAVTLDSADTPAGVTVLAITVRAPARAPRLLHPGPVTLSERAAPMLLAPAGAEQVRVQRRAGTKWLTDAALWVSEDISEPGMPVSAPGIAGARLIDLNANTTGPLTFWSHATRYRLLAGTATHEFRTVALPAATRRRSFRFDRSVRRQERASVRGVVRRARPLARRLLASLDGMVYVRAHGGSGISHAGQGRVGGRGMYILDLARGHLADRSAQRDLLVLHELGHVAGYALMHDSAFRAFNARVRSSRAWRCFPGLVPGACLADAEVFADQFAYYATGSPGPARSPYGDPPLLSRGAMERILRGTLNRSGWAARPPYASWESD